MLRWWQRIEALDAARRETLLLDLIQNEKALADERRARSRKRQPKTR